MAHSLTSDQKYRIRSLLFLGGYVAVNVAAIFGAFDDLRPPGAWLFAIVVAAPVAGHVWSLLAWMRESDEFVRGLAAKRFIVASGAAMTMFSAWGFMESYAGAPHAPCWLIYPLFWLAFGAVAPFIRTSH